MALIVVVFTTTFGTDDENLASTKDNRIYALKLSDLKASVIEKTSDDKNSNFEGNKSFGIDPDTKEEVFLKKGPYGIYLQLGDSKKPKRTSIPKLINIDELDILSWQIISTFDKKVNKFKLLHKFQGLSFKLLLKIENQIPRQPHLGSRLYRMVFLKSYDQFHFLTVR